jgi:putative glutamine amidotransferase
MRPLIGITAGEVRDATRPDSITVQGQGYTYIDAIVRAGGLPIILPITTNKIVLRQIYERVDGLLLAGGNDLNPKLYREKAYPTTTDFSDERDATEIQLAKWALEEPKSILAICRGMQLINVLHGGTLYQELSVDLPTASDHMVSTKLKNNFHLAHELIIEPSSRLVKILGATKVYANSHHHQAIKKLGKDLIVSAKTVDGVIEAIEGTHQSYLIGVQAHPESLEKEVEPRWQKMFASFVEAASQ